MAFVAGVRGGGLLFTFFLSVVLARYAGAEAFGEYSTLFSIMMLLSIPLLSGLSTYIVRETAQHQEQDEFLGRMMNKLIRLSGYYSLVVFIVCGVFLLGSWFQSGDWLYIHLAVFLLTLFPSALIQNISAYWRGLGKRKTGVFFEFLLKPFMVFSAISFILVCLDQPPELWVYLAYLVAVTLVAMVCKWYAGFRRTVYNSPIQTSDWKLFYIEGGLAYLTLAGAMQILLSNLDILLVAFYMTPEDVAVYRVALQFGVVAGFGLTVVNIILQPILAGYYASGNMQAFQHALNSYSLPNQFATTFFCGVLYIFREQLVVFIFGEAYAGAADLVIYILLGQLINVLSGSAGVILNMTKNHRDVVIGLTLSIAILLITSVFLIPFKGLAGAGIAYLAAYLCWNVHLRHTVKKKLNVESAAFLVCLGNAVRRKA
ncbi:oligosaccharide flippase family protein [Neptuniibacter sp. CAU 1671]|uniref:lipopolysaccharide biosynthesis protein n=1 Tax=Neptuniibacter sp. CAU 1671 TaxID=3032593 RepID=UPI0023DA94EF|nr:oligosaccharide flippase family protein [Neptuniibacter sp. CAU 1671]MDF2181407.1 oligosaccharide flippase family protein [Neptuniibacter sp. CAU 1671]